MSKGVSALAITTSSVLPTSLAGNGMGGFDCSADPHIRRALRFPDGRIRDDLAGTDEV